MIFKKKDSPIQIFALLAIIILLFSPKNKEYYINLKLYMYDSFLTMDPGFSSFTNLIGTSNPKKSILIQKSPRILINSFLGLNRENEIPKISLTINFEEYQKILEDRKRSLKKGLGVDFQNVNGKIEFDGEKIKCKVRLKGDHPDHWRSTKRMSFRIKIKGKNSILGFKEFSIQKPSARQFPFDISFQELQKNTGNLSSNSDLVRLIVNNEDWGVMLVEELMTKEFLEKKDLKESLIFKFGDEKIWRFEKLIDGVYSDYRLSNPYLNYKIYDDTKYLLSLSNRKKMSYVAKEILKNKSPIYDIDSFSKSLMMSMAWFSSHSISYWNSRYYFNPYNLKLYPITTDAGHFGNFTGPFKIPEFYERVIQDPLFNENFKKNQNEVKESLDHSQKIFEKWENYFPLDEKLKLDVLFQNMESLNEFDKNIFIDKQEGNFRNSFDLSQKSLLIDHVYARHFENGEIHIYNLLNYDLTLENIYVDGKPISDFKEIIIDRYNTDFKPHVINTELKGLYDFKIEIETDLFDSKRIFKTDYTHVSNEIFNPITKISDLHNHEFIDRDEIEGYTFKKGKWYINSPIVFDNNVKINEGTTLIFNSESYMIINGSLTILGSENEDVILTSNKGYWRGIYIIESKQKSFIKNATFSNLTYLNDGLLELTGAVTFYKSDVDMENVFFENSISEDFLNIVHSNFNLRNVNINNTKSDGFDSDFSFGIIEKSKFTNISGDALDFSGSEVIIKESAFNEIRDKAISIGEKSKVNVSFVTVNDVGVGVASKDGSTSVISKSSFTNFKLNALMTYQKKSFYESSSLIANDIFFDKEQNSFLRQKGSILMIDNNYVMEKKMKVDSLYESVIMKK